MATYPGLPNNRLIVGGKDISIAYGLVMIDGYTLEPPEPKFYNVEVPGSDGFIDLTEALNGDVTYNNRKQQFTFYLIDPLNFEHTKTLISNYLHGRAFDYQISMDPEYTYHGRFSVKAYTQPSGSDSYSGQVAAIQIDIDAEPYKLKQHMTYRVNAVGGRMYTFYSGRKPVRPIIETRRPVRVEWGGQTIQLGIGTFRLNTVLFNEGANSLYLNSLELFTITWDWIQEEEHKMTWNEAGAKYRWDEIQRLGVPEQGGEITAQSWDDFLPDWTSDAGVSPFLIYGYNDGNEPDGETIYYNPASGQWVSKNAAWSPASSQSLDLSGDQAMRDIEANLPEYLSGSRPLPNTAAAKYKISQLYQKYQNDLTSRSQASTTWDDLSDRTWDDLGYTPISGDYRTDTSESQNIVYVSYDWKDL